MILWWAILKKQSSTKRYFDMRPNERLDVGLGILDMILRAFMLKDPYTYQHQINVAEISLLIAKNLGYDREKLLGLKIAASLHDIGKLGVPSALLNKPGELFGHEVGCLKAHASMGEFIFSMNNHKFPWPLKEVVAQHHERIDGSGYPHGLMDKEIKHEAKIVAVADVFESISTDRPYREKLGVAFAIDVLIKGRGKKYDSDCVDILLELIKLNKFNPNVLNGNGKNLIKKYNNTK